VVSCSNVVDETSDHAHLILPDHHFLESWGDDAPRAGVANLLQPAASPLLQSRATGDVLISVARQVDGETRAQFPGGDWPDYVRDYWVASVGRGFTPRQAGREGPPSGDSEDTDQQWGETVRAGGRFADATSEQVALLNVSAAVAGVKVEPPDDRLTLIAYPSPHLYDGRGANQPWLREVPDPVTKNAWSSWIEIHPDTARRLGINNGETIEVHSDTGQITANCYLYAGLHPNAIAVP